MKRLAPTSSLRLCVSFSLVLVLLFGCTQPARQSPPPVMMSVWTFDGKPASSVRTDHYLIHTTIDDVEFLESLGQVLEGALEEYRQFTPRVHLTDRRMECYVFSRRPEWAKFTKDHTGADAAVYLQINRGGYTLRDRFVAYYIGDAGTFAVASHEGWHQYVARHFRCRMPPFLEEGIATMFENMTFSAGRPRWNMQDHPARKERLRAAIQHGRLWPLKQLCTMHAGDVVSLSSDHVETFYAQNWAFAQFLWRGENGRHRPALQRMLNELASGEADAWVDQGNRPRDAWDPRAARPLLEHYLGMDIDQIDAAYQVYMRQLSFGSRD